MSNTIYEMITDNLHITYTVDPATQRRLENEIADGIAFIRKYCDPDATCEPGTEYAALLCEYVLRAESGAAATFAVDFAREIRVGRLHTEVDAFAEAMDYAVG